MLEIHDIETIDKSKLKINKRKTKKTQIFLYDTKRRSDDFINMIKYRKNGEYDDIYLIRDNDMNTFVYLLLFCNMEGYTFRLE